MMSCPLAEARRQGSTVVRPHPRAVDGPGSCRASKEPVRTHPGDTQARGFFGSPTQAHGGTDRKELISVPTRPRIELVHHTGLPL